MCRLGGADKAATRCWVGVPNDVMRLLVGQGLANFRLAACLFRSLTAGLDGDQEEIMSQCERGQSMCSLGGAGKVATRCWVGVPNDELRLLVGQGLADFRLAACLFFLMLTKRNS